MNNHGGGKMNKDRKWSKRRHKERITKINQETENRDASQMEIYDEASLGFGLLDAQNKPCEDVAFVFEF